MKTTINSTFSFLSLAIFAAITTSSCGGGSESTDSKKNDSLSKNVSANEIRYIKIDDATNILPAWSTENVLVYHDIGEPDDLHPTNGMSSSRSEIFGYTQVYVIGTDYQNLTIRPIAVKALPVISPNELEYTYELRNDIKFDDGSVISVDDIIFTFKANKCQLTNNPQAKSYLDYPVMQRTFFDKKNVLANYTFAQFSDPNFKADKQKDLADWAAEFNSAKYSRDLAFQNGAGPYKVEKWDAGQSLTLVRKNNHWSKESKNVYETSFPAVPGTS